jgi:hypothetical protein
MFLWQAHGVCFSDVLDTSLVALQGLDFLSSNLFSRSLSIIWTPEGLFKPPLHPADRTIHANLKWRN